MKLEATAGKINEVIGRDSSCFKTVTEPTWIRACEYASNFGAIGTLTLHFSWTYANIGIDTGTFLGFYQEAQYIPINKSGRVNKYRIVYLPNDAYTKSYIDFLIEPYTLENVMATSTLNDSYNGTSKSLCEYGANIPEGYTIAEYDIT